MKKIIALCLLLPVISCSTANINQIKTEAGKTGLKAEKIIFTHAGKGFDLYSINSDGSDKKQLTTGDQDPVNYYYNEFSSLSPDKSKIVFVSGRDTTLEIYTIDADGKNPKKLTNHQSSFTEPSWSSDGKKIVYETTEASEPAYQTTTSVSNLYIMDADGSNKINITKNTDKTLEYNTPRLSPDGTKVLFSSYISSPEDDSRVTSIGKAGEIKSSESKIYTMNLDGTNKVQISKSAGRQKYPKWSSDGKQILFASTTKANLYNSDEGNLIYTINSDGSNEKQIKSKYEFYGPVSMSSDGEKLVYTSGQNGIVVLNLKTNEERIIDADKNSFRAAFD
jgi:Tol biopolymer transport system component